LVRYWIGNPNLERRTALTLLSAGLLADRIDIANGQLLQIASAPSGYKLQFFSPERSETVAALTETIVPADEHSSGAREANVNLFIDVMLANSEASIQQEWVRGLDAFNAEAQRRFGSTFTQLDAAHRHEVMTTAARNEANPVSELERFFATLKLMTLNGYYTSPIGIHRDLQYKGNTALKNYYGCIHPEHQA